MIEFKEANEKMRIHKILVPWLALLLSWSQLASAAPVVIEHQQGQLRLDAVPTRVVTFDLAALDILDQLGVDVIGVPKDFIPEPLAHYRGDQYAHVGSLFEPDFEAIAALRPDLIIISGRAAPAYRQLSRLAPTIDLTQDLNHFMRDMRAHTRTLARIFDREEAAEAYLAELDANLAATRALGEEAGSALVILTSGGRVSAYGTGSRTGWIYDELGLRPAAGHLKQGTHGDPVSFEFIVQTDPDYLFVLDRDTAIQSGQGSARALLDNDLIRQTRAWRENRVIYLNSIDWYILVYGLQATPRMIEEVRQGLTR